MKLLEFLPCLRACVAMFVFCAVTASAQTVADLAAQPEASQRDAIAAMVATSLQNLMSKTERSGAPKTSDQFESDRAMGNLVQALFNIDPENPNEDPSGTRAMLSRIKKGAISRPNETLAEVMTRLVDSCYAQFYTDFYSAEQKVKFAGNSDKDQATYFRLNFQMYKNKLRYDKIIKELEDREAELLKKISDEYDAAVILSDGRHVLHANNGDFMVVQRNPDSSADYKLEGLYVWEAQSLYNCEQARHLTGIQGRQSCTGETSAPPPAAPVYHPTPTPAPVPAPQPPASPAPVDDPIGSGGFISAPTKFNVMVCIERPLSIRQGWDNPRPGTKMQAFKTMVLTYIVSVAKPDWEYWISESQFASYLMGKTPRADQVVSTVAPGGQYTDPFHPSCPSAYTGYWVQAGH